MGNKLSNEINWISEDADKRDYIYEFYESDASSIPTIIDYSSKVKTKPSNYQISAAASAIIEVYEFMYRKVNLSGELLHMNGGKSIRNCLLHLRKVGVSRFNDSDPYDNCMENRCREFYKIRPAIDNVKLAVYHMLPVIVGYENTVVYIVGFNDISKVFVARSPQQNKFINIHFEKLSTSSDFWIIL